MSLKDELLKAKLIDKKQVKKIEHEKRVEKKQLGTQVVEEKTKAQLAEIAQKQEEQKKRDLEMAAEQNTEKQEKAKSARILDIIQSGKIKVEEGMRGSRKFYFVAQDQRIPYLNLSEGLIEKLDRAEIAIIEYPTREFSIVNKISAEKLLGIEPEIVRFYQK